MQLGEMQTSKRIIVGLALAFLAFLPIGITILRIESQAFPSIEDVGIFEEMTLDSFSSIRIVDYFNVYIEQGLEYKVNYEVISDSVASPKIIQSNQELYLEWDTSQYKTIDSSLILKIEVPGLKFIGAGAGSVVELQKFGKDSLIIELAEGAKYVGGSNNFDYLSIVKNNK